MNEPASRAAGWYPDDRYPGDERWWDGTQWGRSRPMGELETELGTQPTSERSGHAFAIASVCILLVVSAAGYVLTRSDDGLTEVVDSGLTPLVGDGFAFVDSVDGEPVMLNPCLPLGVSWNTAVAPGEEAVLRDALDDFADATGLEVLDLGQTTYIPGGVDTAAVPPDAGSLTIAVASRTGASSSSWLITSDREAIGVGGFASMFGRFIEESFVLVDVEALPGLTRGERRALYLHELGHAAGLDHVDDPSQIMYPELVQDGPRTYGSGDLAGLSLMGDRSGCF